MSRKSSVQHTKGHLVDIVEVRRGELDDLTEMAVSRWSGSEAG